MAPPAHLFDLDPPALQQLVQGLGMPRFRAEQVLQWVYERGVADPAEMTNLAKRDRAALAEHLRFTRGHVLRHQTATDGTEKLLLAWAPDDHAHAPTDAGHHAAGESDAPLAIAPTGPEAWPQTECVMIPAASRDSGAQRRTACISSQVGCPVGCRFCASGLGGLEANLTAGQIVEQAWALARVTGQRISHVVFMGMGEPLANLAHVSRAIRSLMAPWGMGISGRRITVSTVGLPAQIRRLADQQLPLTLAISLHAPDDDLRRRLIPWADRVSIDQLVDAGRYYFDRTRREVTLEYILLGRVNDRPEHARRLAAVAKRLRANVNLIRYNQVADLPFTRPDDGDVLAFQRTLRTAGVNAHIRASRGRDIAAACGQLRHETRRDAAPATLTETVSLRVF